ncbi:MAG: hypothetical protein EI684_16795, partial [Candidatus Viridilinea halotolerans]
PIQYADFAAWQRTWLASGVMEAQLNWWREHLSGAPALLTLPTDYPRPAVQTFAGATHAFTLSAELSAALRSLSRTHGVTLFTTLLAAFQVLLMRSSGQSDLVVGVPVANRTRVEIESLVGMFVNTLAIRSRLADADGNALRFSDLLNQLQQTMLDAQRHQDVPFEQVVEALQPPRSLNHTPLFQVMCNLVQMGEATLDLAGIVAEPLALNDTVAKFDLSLHIAETPGDSPLQMSLEYATALFAPATIARMAGHLVTLLTAVVDHPEETITTLPLLTERERQQLVVEWNNTAAAFPQDRCIHQLVAAQAARTPDAIAVIAPSPHPSSLIPHPSSLPPSSLPPSSLIPHPSSLASHTTYADLLARANQLAHHLQG